jgi:hypothetical protein
MVRQFQLDEKGYIIGDSEEERSPVTEFRSERG